METEGKIIQRHISEDQVTYGKTDIKYKVRPCQRKTLEIAVLPDCTVEVKVPLGCSLELVAQKIKKRAAWILRQKLFFCQFVPRTPPRQYLSGEQHLYLGRAYRLKVIPAQKPSVKLRRGILEVHCNKKSPEEVSQNLLAWYREKANIAFNKTLLSLSSRLMISSEKVPKLQIKKMKSRWGSLSKGGILSLNIELVKAPAECIEYVIVHEFCHIKYHDHSIAFYRLLEQLMPDWKKRKHKLEVSLV